MQPFGGSFPLVLDRRRFLAGCAAAALAVGGRHAFAQTLRTPSLGAARAQRLTKGLSASFWFEWVPTNSPEAMKQHIHDWYQAADFAQIRRLGFDHIRVSLQPDFLAPKLDNADADLDPQRLELFDEAMAGILDNDLAVVLDNHPAPKIKDKIAINDAFRTTMAHWWRNFAGHVAHQGQYPPETTFFEVLNEPEASFSDVERYRTIMGRMISAVRASAPEYTVIVGGARWNVAEAIFQDLQTPFPDPNLIYTFHYYLPLEFTHQGEDNAGPIYGKLKGVPWNVGRGALSDAEIEAADPSVRATLRAYNGRSHRKADLRWQFVEMQKWCRAHGQVAWLGEFGVYDEAARPEDRARWVRDVRELAEEHGFGWAMWEARGGFGLLRGDARPLEVDRPLLQSLGL